MYTGPSRLLQLAARGSVFDSPGFIMGNTVGRLELRGNATRIGVKCHPTLAFCGALRKEIPLELGYHSKVNHCARAGEQGLDGHFIMCK